MSFIAEDNYKSAERVRERISAQFVALLGILVLAPLPFGGNRAWALALIGMMVFALLVWHIWMPDTTVVMVRDNGRRMPWQRALLPLYLMAVWVALLAFQLVPLPASWVAALDLNPSDSFPVISGRWATVSVDPYSTRIYFLKGLVLLAFFWLLLRLTTTPARVELLVKTMVFCGFVQATVAVVLFATAASYSLFFVHVEHGSAHGTFINRNHLAGFLEMTLAVGIGLMIAKLDDQRVRTWKQWARDWLAVLVSEKARLRIMLIVMVVGLIATRSRMGNAAFFFSLLIAGAIGIALSKHATRATVIFIASLLVLDIVIIGGVVGVEKVFQRIENTNLRKFEPGATDSGATRQGGGLELRKPEGSSAKPGGSGPQPYREQSVEERTEAARQAAITLRDFPILGTGGGSFHIAFVPFQPSGLRGYFDHAENDFAEFMIETGIIGLGLLASIVLASLFHALHILLVRRNRLARGMAFGSLMGIVALMIHSFVDFNLQIFSNSLFFIIILLIPYLVGSRGNGIN
jgi:hypothetical protein